MTVKTQNPTLEKLHLRKPWTSRGYKMTCCESFAIWKSNASARCIALGKDGTANVIFYDGERLRRFAVVFCPFCGARLDRTEGRFLRNHRREWRRGERT